jgi:hypothetical protein
MSCTGGSLTTGGTPITASAGPCVIRPTNDVLLSACTCTVALRHPVPKSVTSLCFSLPTFQPPHRPQPLSLPSTFPRATSRLLRESQFPILASFRLRLAYIAPLPLPAASRGFPEWSPPSSSLSRDSAQSLPPSRPRYPDSGIPVRPRFNKWSLRCEAAILRGCHILHRLDPLLRAALRLFKCAPCSCNPVLFDLRPRPPPPRLDDNNENATSYLALPSSYNSYWHLLLSNFRETPGVLIVTFVTASIRLSPWPVLDDP